MFDEVVNSPEKTRVVPTRASARAIDDISSLEHAFWQKTADARALAPLRLLAWDGAIRSEVRSLIEEAGALRRAVRLVKSTKGNAGAPENAQHAEEVGDILERIRQREHRRRREEENRRERARRDVKLGFAREAALRT
jgi:hypothetical protein